MKDPFIIANKVLSIGWNNKIPVSPKKIVNKILIKDYKNEIPIKLVGHKSINFTINNKPLSSSSTYSERDGAFVCNYNIDNHSNRIKFSIAHGLGHICLNHLKYNKEFYDSEFKNLDKKELDANVFACIILMPDDAINFHIKNMKDSNKNEIIQKISLLFLVPENAVKFRLKMMNLI